MMKSHIKYREYIIYAAIARLKSEVSNSYLNWIWWILEPALNMLVYFVVFGRFLKLNEPFYPLFLYIGVAMWNFFGKCVTGSVGLVRRNRDIITNVRIPKTVLLFKDILVNFFKMMLSFVIIGILMICYRVKADVSMLYFIPVMLELMLFTFGVCCYVLHLGVYYEDMEYVISILLNILMFFSGIFYSIEGMLPGTIGCLLGTVNPIAFLIISMRNSLIYGRGMAGAGMIIWLPVFILLSYTGCRLIKRNENNYVKLR